MTTKPVKPKAARPAKTKKAPTPAPTPAAEPAVKKVALRYPAAAAASVFVAGTFNQWHPSASPMQLVAGEWLIELELPPGVYEYRLIVDGAWINDPAESDSLPNPFGGSNSVLRVS